MSRFVCEVIDIGAIVYKFLQSHYGRENAIKSADLARYLGFKTVRELQKQIEVERTDGYVILSDSQGAGYYLSEDPVELRRFVNTLNARAANTLRASESAQRALDAVIGQERMDGWW